MMRPWWNGRHACLRSKCRKVYGFESLQSHDRNDSVRSGWK